MIKLTNRWTISYLAMGIFSFIVSLKSMIVWFSSELTPSHSHSLRWVTFSFFFVSGFAFATFVLDFILKSELHYPYLQLVFVVAQPLILFSLLVTSLYNSQFNVLSQNMFSNKFLLILFIVGFLILSLLSGLKIIHQFNNTRMVENEI